MVRSVVCAIVALACSCAVRAQSIGVSGNGASIQQGSTVQVSYSDASLQDGDTVTIEVNDGNGNSDSVQITIGAKGSGSASWVVPAWSQAYFMHPPAEATFRVITAPPVDG